MPPRHRVIVTAALIAGFAVFRLLQTLPPLIAGPFLGWSSGARLVQGVLALITCVGLWLRKPWGAVGILFLAVAVAITALGDAFLSGILAPLHAVLLAVLALILGYLLARWVGSDLRAARG